jgi:glycosyltransferase involved in cell wall biosynthesis
MRIGIDARELCGKPTGVGRHLAGLLGGWAASADARRHTLFLYAHQPITTPFPAAEVRIAAGSGGTQWEQITLPSAARRDRLDVFFAPGYTAPLTWTVPTVVLVHDISFVAHPEWFRWREGLRRRTITRWSSHRARLVLTVSETARSEILSHFGLPAERVRCIYPGVVSLRGVAGAVASREPLVLFVGSIFNRRHIPDLIRAFAPIARDQPRARLEIVGDNRTYPHEDLPFLIADEKLGDRVILRPYVFDDELAELYARASACALLSDYEGFGHPPLEALAAGVPSVLLDTPVAREVCGDAALYVRADDLPAITTALGDLLFDESVRSRILDAGPAVLARYSWTRAAAETLRALEMAAGG